MNDLLTHIQSVQPPVLTMAVLVLATVALVVHEPISGRRSFARFLAQEAAEGETARLRFYRSWTVQGCVTALLAIALVLVLPGVGLADIGFRAPDLAGVDRFGITGGSVSTSTIAGMITGVLVMVVMMVVVSRVKARRDARGAGEQKPAAEPRGQMKAILPMLPRSGAGRRGWAMLSLSAGVTEEITYRGLLLLTLAVALPSTTPRVTLVIAAAVLFGLAHWYQGWTGIVSTALVGGVMAGLYLSTGSLLVPMILHTLIDLRALLLPVPRAAQTPVAETTPAAPATSA
jgi:membrane protease YdiL (CAAX protease family)